MRRLSDDRGSAALEMALITPTLLLVVMVLVETMVTVWLNSALESGVRVASRFGLTGYAPEGMSRRSRIIAEPKRRTLGLVDDGGHHDQGLR